jgi:hypothetical protein
MADAEARCEAMSRPTMRFVPIKTADQQAALMLVGLRDRLIRNRTQLSNAIRGYAAEFGLTAANGLANLRPLLERIQADEGVPDLACELFAAQAEEYAQLEEQIAEISAKLMAWHKADECSRRLAKIPGIGPIGAALLMMKTPAPELFRSGRQFAAWIGLTPRDHSTAGKVKLTLLLPGGLFPRSFALAVLPFPFVGESGLPLRRLVDGAGGSLLGFGPLRRADAFRRSSVAAQIGGQFGMFAEGSVGTDGSSEDDARFLHGRGDDVRIVALLRRTLMEEIAVGAPRFQGRFHRRSGDRLIEEAQRSLIGLQLPRHEGSPALTADGPVYLASRVSAKRANSAGGPGYTSTQPAPRSEASVKPPQSTPMVEIFAFPAAAAS